VGEENTAANSGGAGQKASGVENISANAGGAGQKASHDEKPEPKKSAEPIPRGSRVPSSLTIYGLISELVSSLVTLLIGIAWPAVVLIILSGLVEHGPFIRGAINDFFQNKQSVKASAGPSGVTIEITSIKEAVAAGLTQQITHENKSPPSPAIAEEIEQQTSTAADKLARGISGENRVLVKVLWVDPHPNNNIGLQYAFAALGIVVVCVNSDAGISTAFSAADSFDVVITNMARENAELGGLQTVQSIKADYPGVPVIIYSSGYAEAHKNDPLVPPVKAITNSPREVFNIVTNIAAKRRR